MGFNAETAAREIAPTFKFERLGDKVRLRITDVDDTVELDDKDKGELRGYAKFLAIKGEVVKAKGGDVDKASDEVTDAPTGEERSILAQYEYKALSSDEFKAKPSIIAKAIARAITAAGKKELEVGGELYVCHHELGKRNAENPSWNRPKFYEAEYTPPAKSSSALGGVALEDDTF